MIKTRGKQTRATVSLKMNQMVELHFPRLFSELAWSWTITVLWQYLYASIYWALSKAKWYVFDIFYNLRIEFEMLLNSQSSNTMWGNWQEGIHLTLSIYVFVLVSRCYHTASHIQPDKMYSCITSNVVPSMWHDCVLIMYPYMWCTSMLPNCAPLSIICDLDNYETQY
jgi:hypothetical protein